MSNTIDMNNLDQTSLAGRILAAGDKSGLPLETVKIFYSYDVRKRDRHNDQKLSKEYIAQLDGEDWQQTDQAIFEAEERDVAVARQSLEDERTTLLNQIKNAGDSHASSVIETADERQTRLARRTI